MLQGAEIRLAQGNLELEQAADLRRSVLCGEFHWPREIIADPPGAIVFLAFFGAKPIGTLRLLKLGTTCQLEALAVLPAFRRKGLGKAILQAAESEPGQAQVFRALAPAESASFFIPCGYKEMGKGEGLQEFEKLL
jgi:GNAT superfamily N-acetyltransferase